MPDMETINRRNGGNMNILVLDIGTSSMRGILFSEKGAELASKQYIYRPDYLENGWVEQEPSVWEQAMYEILRTISCETAEKGIRIDGISITALRSSIFPVDDNIRPLCKAIMWQDKRTLEICENLEAENNKIFPLSGSRVNPVFSASKMTWIRKERPDIYAKTYKFVLAADYLIYLLTGNLCTDYTYGSRSHLMNIRTCQWDDELLKLFEVEKEKLCPLVEPGSICGYMTEQAAKRTGCMVGIPIITAGGDQQCGAVGQGIIKEGTLSVTAGTGGFLVTAVNEVPKNLQPHVLCNHSSLKNQYILESSVLTCSSAFDWFCRNFYENATYDEINQVLEHTEPGANGVLCVPYFQGRSTPDWNGKAKAGFVNLTLHSEKADMLRALLEGICYEIANGIDILKNYVKIEQIFINGGLTNSKTFNEIQADVYGKNLLRRGKADATARGALMIALHACEVYRTIEEAFENIGNNGEIREYHPNMQKWEFYQQNKAKMNLLYEKIYVE